MDAIKLKPSLEKFLKEKGAYDGYVKNLIEGSKECDWQIWADSICEEMGYDCFSCAFLWHKTEEGVDYWWALAHEFEKIDN